MRTLLFFLLFPVVSLAVDAPTVAKRDQPIAIEHEAGETINAIFGAVEQGAFVWRFLPDAHFIRAETVTYFAAPPGEYIIIVGESRIIKVVEEGTPGPRPNPGPSPGPEPQPNPDPDPQPDPEPEPDGEQFSAEWVIWIEEIQDRSKHPAETQAMLSVSMDNLIRDLGLKKRVYDDDQSEAAGFLKLVGNTRPAMVVLGKDPKEYKVFPAPTSVDDAEALIRGVIVR